ncbi:hypothetical protein [Modicisalibacter radicis]|uniref:hypothetical protein n=1 Tax=Halomonas sp. EAR18 TaxID=2518972 RepID=UPI0014446828|nr:hypothetical protein [Halomonas sp. EAR18]
MSHNKVLTLAMTIAAVASAGSSGGSGQCEIDHEAAQTLDLALVEQAEHHGQVADTDQQGNRSGDGEDVEHGNVLVGGESLGEKLR